MAHISIVEIHVAWNMMPTITTRKKVCFGRYFICIGLCNTIGSVLFQVFDPFPGKHRLLKKTFWMCSFRQTSTSEPVLTCDEQFYLSWLTLISVYHMPGNQSRSLERESGDLCKGSQSIMLLHFSFWVRQISKSLIVL